MIGWKARSFLAALCLAPWLATAPAAADAATDGPVEFINSLGHATIAMLTDDALSDDERVSEFRRFLNQGFDLDAISRFALGRYWRRATTTEREEYRILFEEFIVHAYSSRLGRYGGETFEVLGTIAGADGETIVRTELRDPGGPPIRVDWRTRETGPGYRIVDVTLEGVSMAITQRDEFAAVIRSNGGTVAGLINALREKAVSVD